MSNIWQYFVEEVVYFENVKPCMFAIPVGKLIVNFHSNSTFSIDESYPYLYAVQYKDSIQKDSVINAIQYETSKAQKVIHYKIAQNICPNKNCRYRKPTLMFSHLKLRLLIHSQKGLTILHSSVRIMPAGRRRNKFGRRILARYNHQRTYLAPAFFFRKTICIFCAMKRFKPEIVPKGEDWFFICNYHVFC